jgi:plasmid stabilization system protein ParE
LCAVVAPSARNDIREALIWSQERFGQRAAEHYRELIKQALRDIVVDPQRPGPAERRRRYATARRSSNFRKVQHDEALLGSRDEQRLLAKR